jgi:SsrA-binding protein
VLSGSEVKSVRERRISLDEAFVKIAKGEVWLMRANISPYGNAREFGHDPVAKRKLLLNRREIDQLIKATELKGFTIVPLRIFTQNGFIKVEIGVAKGKAGPDKRETIKKRDAERELRRAVNRRD